MNRNPHSAVRIPHSALRIPQSELPTPHSEVLRLLILEDRPPDAELEVASLEAAGYTCRWERVDTREEFLARLQTPDYDLLLADYALPTYDGLSALKLVRRLGIDIPFIFVTGTLGEETAIESLKAGATDYVLKTRLARLVPVVRRALQEREEHRQRQAAERALRDEAQIAGALARVGRELISALSAPVILQRLCRLTSEVLACDCSHTLLAVPQDDAYVPVSAYGETAEQWEALRTVKIPRPWLAAIVARLQQEEIAQVVATTTTTAGAALARQFGITMLLCVALRRGAGIAGIQTACFRGRQEPFSPLQERIARGIGQLASLALENARLVEELERANRLKSEFVATMSHELRTPLFVITGYAELLNDQDLGPLSVQQAEALGRILKSVQDLTVLITATLDLHRLETGRAPLELSQVPVGELLGELCAEVRALQTKPGISFACDIPADLPRLRTDAAKLKVVVKNLVDNAFKFTDQGRVLVAAQPRDGGIEITVRDTGIGIAPESLQVIFEPFRQLEASLTRRHGGVGLGLYVVRRLLDLLGGTITVDSEAGRGSTFRVRLPSQPPATPQ